MANPKKAQTRMEVWYEGWGHNAGTTSRAGIKQRGGESQEIQPETLGGKGNTEVLFIFSLFWCLQQKKIQTVKVRHSSIMVFWEMQGSGASTESTYPNYHFTYQFYECEFGKHVFASLNIIVIFICEFSILDSYSLIPSWGYLNPHSQI